MHALQAAPGHIWIGEYSPALTPEHLARSRGKMSGYFFNAQASREKQAHGATVHLLFMCI